MSVLALLYMAITPLLAKRYSEKGRYYAWLVIVIGLIIPFRPSWTSAIFTVDVPVANVGDYFANTATQTWNGNITTIPTLVIDASTLPIATTFSITLWQGITVVWLIGAVAFIALQVIRHYRFAKTARRWSETITNKQILSTFNELKAEMGIKKRIGLCINPCAGSPMMIGFIKPQILLPTEELAEDELRFILKHELVHYKRNDLLYKSLVLVATAIHWFNPVVYLMARVVDSLCETSCDAEVVRNANKDTRLEYSETIIGAVKYRSKTKLSTAFSTNFYGGKKGMKNRISSIMDTSKKRAGAFILFGMLILTLGTGVVVVANLSVFASQEIIAESVEQVELITNEPVEFIEIESDMSVVVEIPERNASAEMTYLLLILEGSSEVPTMQLEHAVRIGANAIYSEFGLCIDGLTGRMLFIDGADGIQRWVGNIFSEELTTHSDANELFHFSINAETDEVLWMHMNTVDTPFNG